MNVLIFIQTPAQVHFWKNIRKQLENRGHSVLFLYRDRGETLALAKELGLYGVVYTRTRGTGLSKILSFPLDIIRGWIISSRYRPDVVCDFGIYGALVSRLLGKPCLIFTDSEPSITNIFSVQYRIFVPLVDIIVTPRVFRDDLGKKHVKIDSYKELAYLHPNYFKPNADIFTILGIKKEDHYVLLRFNDLAGVHDIGLNGFSLAKKIELVKIIESSGQKVFISFEGDVPIELSKYRIKIPKKRIHDVLYFADMLITDTQTMATEAALLGTTVIRCNTFVGDNDMGNFKSLEKTGYLFNFKNPDLAIFKIKNLLNQKKKPPFDNNMIQIYKFDIITFMTNLIESYKKES